METYDLIYTGASLIGAGILASIMLYQEIKQKLETTKTALGINDSRAKSTKLTEKII